jgi:hypothetical protein
MANFFYNHLSKVMQDLSKNVPARMVRYVRRFRHLWLAQRHPKPSLADVVGLVTISIDKWLYVTYLWSQGTKVNSVERQVQIGDKTVIQFFQYLSDVYNTLYNR